MRRSLPWLHVACLLVALVALFPTLAAISAAAAPPAPRALVVDQQQTTAGAGHGLVQGAPHWQDFTAALNNVARIKISTNRWGDPLDDLSLTVTDYAGHELWSGWVENADIPDAPAWIVAESAPALLMPGARYRLVVEGMGPDESGGAVVYWHGTNYSGYLGGDSDIAWQHPSSPDYHDFAFQTWAHDDLPGIVLDEEQAGTSYGYLVASDAVRWQEFVPEELLLAGFAVNVHRSGDPDGAIIARLVDRFHRTLYEATCPAPAVGEPVHWASFHFPAPLPVVPGQTYRIELAATYPYIAGNVVAWRGNPDSDYDEGASSISGNPDFDFAFRVWGWPQALVGSRFTEVADGAVGDAGAGRGVCLLDVTGDGLADAHVTNHDGPDQLLRNDGALVFTDIAGGPLAEPGPSVAASWADFDHDGDRDLYLSRDGQANRLLKNDGGGGLYDVAQFGLEDAGPGRGVSWVDFDRDGLLDLYLVNHGAANRLFRYVGEFGPDYHVFTLVTGPVADSGPGTMGVWCDYDRDGDQDLYVARPVEPNLLLRNDAPFGFADDSGVVANPGDTRGAAWADADNDGWVDLYVSNSGNQNALYRNGPFGFQVVPGALIGDAEAGRAVVWFDVDNDADLDLFLGRYDQPDLLLIREADGSYSYAHVPYSPESARTTAAAAADLDQDGDLDLFVVKDGQPNVILRNDGLAEANWLAVRLTGDATMPRDGIGAKVRVVAGAVAQVRDVTSATGHYSQDPYTQHFGLGAATAADSLIVTWPDGSQSVSTGVAAGQVVDVVAGSTTGAPGPGAVPGLAAAILGIAPNPFNPSTQVKVRIPEAGLARVAVYDLAGARVATLLQEQVPAGIRDVTWDGRDARGMPVASGTYVFRLECGGHAASRTAVLVK